MTSGRRYETCYRRVFRRVAISDLLILDDAGFSDLGRDATILRFSGRSYRQPRDLHDAPLDNE